MAAVNLEWSKKMNRLQYESSPYLLQHASNPVDWYPWGSEAFERAKKEDKPVFLSIGYSTCHWCHVMAHESFEDAKVADILNRHFVSVKVDKEDRPDVDSIYMNVCMALTGSGGWPMTIIMDHTGKPFFAGTYFPKHSRYGMPGLIEILEAVNEKWGTKRKELTDSADKIVAYINAEPKKPAKQSASTQLIRQGIDYFKSAFDKNYGGFGRAPKFPAPHNLLFLMEAYETLHDESCLEMVEKTLMSMAKGGIFDHIGFGFSRYSTDEKWLAPHFEKMLYDNALLIMAYTKAYEITQKPVYKAIAEKTILYISREMTHPDGGFYAAQDADSDGVEGKYYVFTPEEVVSVLGEAEGHDFCRLYDITQTGNFEGKSIPNQISLPEPDYRLEALLPKLYEYRKARAALHKDDKILTAWNMLMVAALSDASAAFGNKAYLDTSRRAVCFIEANLLKDDRFFTSFRDGKHSGPGVLEDYAFYIYALLRLYNADPKPEILKKVKFMTHKAITEFFDDEKGGFYLTGSSAETLISRPKQSYDNAIPSGNSVMTSNLITLNLLTGEYGDFLDSQINFMLTQAADIPGGHSFFLYALLKRDYAVRKSSDYICDENGCRLAGEEPGR